MSGDNIMEDIRAASEALGTAEAPAPETVVEPAAQAPTPPAPSRARDDSGRFAPKPKEAEPSEPVTPTEEPVAPKPATPEGQPKPEETPAPATPQRKPPQAWKPGAREKWAALPPEVQEEVARVDGETQRVLRESAQARKMAEGFERTVAPYRALLTGEPLAVVGNLLQTAAQLQTAPPAHKAALVASIIKSHGVDVDEINNALGGQPQQERSGPAEYRDPRVDQLLAHMQAQQQRAQQAVQTQAQQELDALAAEAEFLDDVRDTMADMLEVAARRGVALSPKEAYNRAVAMHPEVSKVLEQRKAASNATATTAATQRSKAAASSVKSQPAPGVASSAGKGRAVDDVLSIAAELSGR